jgi:predicted ArsR family transcriptional regulator
MTLSTQKETLVAMSEDGWKTRKQWSDKWGLKPTATKDRLNCLVQSGMFESERAATTNRTGALIVVPVYRITAAGIEKLRSKE